MKLQHLLKRKNKKAWIRIVEAFIAVLMVFSAVLVINVKQRAIYKQEAEKEITKWLSSFIKFIRYDEDIRSQVLARDLTGVNETLSKMIPKGYSYAIRNCSVLDICSLGCYIKGDVYTDETLFFANLTVYNPTKLKIFVWKGGWPENCPQFDYSKPPVQVPYCGDGICKVPEESYTCPQDCPQAILTLTYIVTNVVWNGTHWLYNHTKQFTEFNNVSVNLTKGQSCLKSLGCDASNTTLSKPYIIPANGQYNATNKRVWTNQKSDIFLARYWGTDKNGHNISVEGTLCVAENNYWTKNCSYY